MISVATLPGSTHRPTPSRWCAGGKVGMDFNLGQLVSQLSYATSCYILTVIPGKIKPYFLSEQETIIFYFLLKYENASQKFLEMLQILYTEKHLFWIYFAEYLCTFPQNNEIYKNYQTLSKNFILTILSSSNSYKPWDSPDLCL